MSEPYTLGFRFRLQPASGLSPEAIDATCREALADGCPYCPWIGSEDYSGHLQRKRAIFAERITPTEKQP